jgi:hypothetical protein
VHNNLTEIFPNKIIKNVAKNKENLSHYELGKYSVKRELLPLDSILIIFM